jgi:hypothetical protein
MWARGLTSEAKNKYSEILQKKGIFFEIFIPEDR